MITLLRTRPGPEPSTQTVEPASALSPRLGMRAAAEGERHAKLANVLESGRLCSERCTLGAVVSYAAIPGTTATVGAPAQCAHG